MYRFPYILRGYRDNYSFRDCMISLLQWHNETINIWTSIASLCMGIHLHMNMGCHTIFFIGQLIHHPISICYHLFMPVAPWLRNVDRTAIVIMNLCASWSILYAMTFNYIYVIIVTIFITSVSMGLLVRSWNIKKSDRKTLLYPIVSSALGYYIPVIIYSLLYSTHWITTMATPCMLLSHGLGAIIYVNHWPQRWWPGAFDYGWHSHNLMHILVFGCYNFGYIYLITLVSARTDP